MFGPQTPTPILSKIRFFSQKGSKYVETAFATRRRIVASAWNISIRRDKYS